MTTEHLSVKKKFLVLKVNNAIYSEPKACAIKGNIHTIYGIQVVVTDAISLDTLAYHLKLR